MTESLRSTIRSNAHPNSHEPYVQIAFIGHIINELPYNSRIQHDIQRFFLERMYNRPHDSFNILNYCNMPIFPVTQRRRKVTPMQIVTNTQIFVSETRQSIAAILEKFKTPINIPSVTHKPKPIKPSVIINRANQSHVDKQLPILPLDNISLRASLSVCDQTQTSNQSLSQSSDINITKVISEPIDVVKPPAQRSVKKLGRKPLAHTTPCEHCGTLVTPEWRKGPSGRNTLCNACGLQYAKNLKKGVERKKNNQFSPMKVRSLLNPASQPINAPYITETKKRKRD